MPVCLGPFELGNPFVLAPMAGITHSPFRRLMRRMKSALVISELVSANGIEFESQRTLELLKFHEEERPVGLQIFGEDTQNLCNAAKYVETLGADFIDLNLGCSVPKVIKKGAGAALCRDVVSLGKLLSAMVQSIKIPLTIKIRTGWDSKTPYAHEVVKVATEAGVAWVSIHGRTRAQGYSGQADWDLIGEVKAKSSIPIIGNGDVIGAEMALKYLRTYGVDAVMIGRGALRNPFIFEQAVALWRGEEMEIPGPDRYIHLLEQLRELLLDGHSQRMAMIHARKFLSWFSVGFVGCHEFRRRLFTIDDPELLWNEAFAFFREHSRHRDMQFLTEEFLMGGHG